MCLVIHIEEIMSLNLAEVKKVARLARLKLEEGEEKKLLEELNKIFAWIDELQELDTGGVEPLYNVHDASCPVFEDEPVKENTVEDVLANSPVKPIQNFFRVPKVIE